MFAIPLSAIKRRKKARKVLSVMIRMAANPGNGKYCDECNSSYWGWEKEKCANGN